MTDDQRRRFDERLDKTDPGGCWLWRGATNNRGAPVVYVGKTPRIAAKVALQLAGVPVAPGQDIVRTCSNPRCCNPAHMQVTSRRARFKGIKPEPQGKLNPAAIREIRESTLPLAELATRFGVSRTAIGRCRRGETWTSV